MQAPLVRILLICAFTIAAAIAVWGQSRGQRPRYPTQTRPPASRPTPPPVEGGADVQDPQEVVKTDTNLVTVPVIAVNSDGIYVPDLSKAEFGVEEDGVKQEVSFFATVTEPFHVVLMLDTSASTREKLRAIRAAAISFVDQLQTGDKVKVISFDDQVRDHNEFTGDRALLRSAINRTEPGQGTKVYDAFDLALNSIRTIQGRKAIVLFTDGVDWYSDNATFDGTLRNLEEEGVIVYPIRYETRAETERLAQQQQDEMMPELPTRGVINRPAPGTTAPTFPSDDQSTVPTAGQTKTSGPFGLPPASEILRRRREAERERQERGGGNRRTTDPPTSESRYPGDRGSNAPVPTRRSAENESIKSMLDLAYSKADGYLIALADKSGGRLLRADTLASLPDAFARIAAELRTQYAIGYYPTNKDRNGTFRKIKVTSSRKGVKLRARPGYRAPLGG